MDAPPGGAAPGELLGVDDPALATVVDHQALRAALARLPKRERGIVAMRFFHDLTQSQIAARVGCSQMHVSRLLSRTLGHLRHQLLADG
ncbi:sigma-70 family RNA polymerase sigma factor [Cryptosporangium japonicum]|uniref:RNA polymerase sigma-70 region 4 domain-containing protein n=1 Tax=Cryptosporangium japonicum TaxID=80872 RepID=A0ABN0U8Z7_9ACTN